MAWKLVKEENPDFVCHKCETNDQLNYRISEDDEGHEDVNYWCEACGCSWWVEGSDY